MKTNETLSVQDKTPDQQTRLDRSALERSGTSYRKPRLTRHGKVTDLTLGGSPSPDLESDGSIGRFGTPKN